MPDINDLSPHILYEASVQDVEWELEFFLRVWKRSSKRVPLRFREDFCGTAAMAAHWAASHPKREAWGLDLHAPTLQWGLENRVAPIGDAVSRVHLLRQNVLDPFKEKTDIICALNFSYWVFQERATLQQYFETLRESLVDDGIFILDIYGGPLAMEAIEEKRKILAGKDSSGIRYPSFTYIWHQEHFDHLSQQTRCHIHFEQKGQPRIQRAFTYDWRLWTPPEITDLLYQSGFSKVDFWVEGWDRKTQQPNGQMRERKKLSGMKSFIAYLVARI